MSMPSPDPAAPPTPRKWQPLTARQRRVFGVLIEKAKTTPDAYPMTINGLVSGCNQKNNREPQTNYHADDVEQILDELRGFAAVTEVQGSGRVAKYRHHAYEWLGVEKAELAIMAELLLRGEQTVGELRGRAARMDPIPDLAALKPLVESLLKKGLMLELTPPGRGQIVSHALYKEKELAELKTYLAAHPPERHADDGPTPPPPLVAGTVGPAVAAQTGRPITPPGITSDEFAELSVEVAELRADLARLKDLVQSLDSKLQSLLS